MLEIFYKYSKSWRKKLWYGDEAVNIIWAGSRCEKEWEVLGGERRLVIGYEYEEWENMKYFENPIIVLGYMFYNVFYYLVE